MWFNVFDYLASVKNVLLILECKYGMGFSGSGKSKWLSQSCNSAVYTHKKYQRSKSCLLASGRSGRKFAVSLDEIFTDNHNEC